MKKRGVEWFPAAKKLVIKLLSTSDSIYLVAESDVIGAASRKNGRCYLFSLSFIYPINCFIPFWDLLCAQRHERGIYIFCCLIFFYLSLPLLYYQSAVFLCSRVYNVTYNLWRLSFRKRVKIFIVLYLFFSFKYSFSGVSFRNV